MFYALIGAALIVVVMAGAAATLFWRGRGDGNRRPTPDGAP